MRRILSAMALLTYLPLTLAAQESEPPRSYPAELVLGLLGSTADDLTVGGVPEEVAEKLPLPAGAELQGALRGHWSTRIVLRVEGATSEVEEAYATLLESRGWIRPLESEPKGLVSDNRDGGRIYCADTGVSVSFHAGPASGRSTRLTAWLTADRGESPCSRRPAERYRQPVDEAPFPTLIPPEGARAQGSGSRRGPDSTEQTIRLASDLATAELFDHYATQLRAAGWTDLGYCKLSALAVQTWRLDSPDGSSWDGILTVFRAGAETDTRTVSLRLSRLDGEATVGRGGRP